jgi:predicted nucleic acid-binding protein
MIILDTNVVSEPLRPQPDQNVMAWLDRQVADTLYLTSVNLAELLAGIEKMPLGRRRTDLAADMEDLIDQLFGPRILSFDREAARAYARLTSLARASRRAILLADAFIAAIAGAQSFSVATRDTEPFLAVGVRVVNPWLA